MTIDVRNIVSFGRLLGSERVTVSRLRRAIARAGVSPVLTINSVDHFDEPAAERIRAALHEQDNAQGEDR